MVRCRTHACAFTLYPPGYAPYRRQAVMRVAPDGRPIRGESDQERTDFGGTVFQAALSTRRSQPLVTSSGQELSERRGGTQRRHLRLAARLVGVARGLADRVRCSIAAVLWVPTLQLIEGSRAVGCRGIGEAVCGVLTRLRGVRRAWHLLVCGHLTGSWGEPLHWHAERQVLERSPFVAPAPAPAR